MPLPKFPGGFVEVRAEAMREVRGTLRWAISVMDEAWYWPPASSLALSSMRLRCM
jgi:hypothetical protein